MNISINRSSRRLTKYLSTVLGKIIFIGLTALIFFFYQFVFQIKQIDCHFGIESCPETISNVLESLRHLSIFRINIKQVQASISTVGLSQSSKIRIQLPSSLIVDIEPEAQSYGFKGIFSVQTPYFSFKQSTTSAEITSPTIEINSFLSTQSGNTFVVTRNGTTVGKELNTNNILVRSSFPDRATLITIFRWLNILESGGLKDNQIYFIDDMIILKVEGLPDAIFGIDKDPQLSLKSLQSIRSLVTIDSIKLIDFRFNHPILR